MKMVFSSELLESIGAWQNGWREQQDRRSELAKQLEAACASLSSEFRTVNGECYRKRFLHKGELVPLILKDNLDEGLVSWTTDIRFAERFKGLFRSDAVSGAIFRHTPPISEVVVNISSLWDNKEFVRNAEEYRAINGKYADALFHFRATQSEVVLRSPLKGSQIIALTGASSPFDEICDREGIPENQRDSLIRQLIDKGVYPGEYRFLSETGTRGVIDRTIRQVIEKIQAARSAPPAMENKTAT